MSSVWLGETILSKDEKVDYYFRFNTFSAYMGDLNSYEDSMDMIYKGVETEFSRIYLGYKAIDFSGNKLEGWIPKSIGLLKELRFLNLSSNAFIGNIPSSLANITNLEALDLSRNKLSGHIPRDLGNLSFVSYFDFSHNLLEGPVPRGTQLQRQHCSSFEDNLRLIGLEEICGNIYVPDASSLHQQPEDLSSEPEQVVNWIAAAIAYVPGVFCGLVIGHIFISHKHEWFV
uniref:Receptor-like protein 12 n=1 Tax=Noccaea caerulescens TaxID=107243 RepID=A0A1J3IY72_NOCCA